MKTLKFVFASLFFFLLISCTSTKELTLNEQFNLKTTNFEENYPSFREEFKIPRGGRIDTLLIDESKKEMNLFFTKDFAALPLRNENVKELQDAVKKFFGETFRDYSINIYANNYKLEELIPNYFRSDKNFYDTKRLPLTNLKDRIPIVQNSSKPISISNGLFNNNILLWHSHGWYYDVKEKRWLWQRARLFQTVEDIGPLAFTIPYLIPMLENAGANVFIPRERDIQINEIVVDNDFGNTENYVEQSENDKWMTSELPGFAMKDTVLREGDNPFKQGTSRYIFSNKTKTAQVNWIPDIPESGEYAVYISYNSSPDNVSDAHYVINHLGGSTEFKVNQKIGGGTWIYLGTFKFKEGRDINQSIVLTNKSNEAGKIVSADAVRFGGGMGIVEREGQLSKRAKFVEGARYWLQYAGIPDTIVYNLNKSVDDYKDDYQSRGEYGNYLYGNPFGPNRKRGEKGLGIPIDVSLAFHTDAGITKNDTVIGTLMIYSTPGLDSSHNFPDGVSRLANRDLADIVQTQIVEDLKLSYDSAWNRRMLWDAMYSEAARPNFPSMLLELLSHQNFLDMKFGLDPRFRFFTSRSIYKGILKFLATQYDYEYVVQPLPVTHFQAILDKNGKLSLKWEPQEDRLEPTAKAESYIVYTRLEDGGFDNGKAVSTNQFEIQQLDEGKIYSFKVTALNKGGESFPSEILSVCWLNNGKDPVLIVNGFDRVSAAAYFESDSFTGFLNFVDEGVPDKLDYGFTGVQFNFNPDSKWETDDSPGHGASASNYETQIIAGNSFDYPFIHGEAIKKNGFSFCSASDESIMDGSVSLNDYSFVDLILGEEKKTPPPKINNVKPVEFEAFPIVLREKIKSYLTAGGNLFVSGAYVGTDLYSDIDSSGIVFANNVLKLKLKTGHAVKTGKVYSVNDNFIANKSLFSFNTDFDDKVYKVEAPDEIGAINGSEVLLRYAENEFSAATGFKGGYNIVVFGFPFETINEFQSRTEVMKSILDYLEID